MARSYCEKSTVFSHVSSWKKSYKQRSHLCYMHVNLNLHEYLPPHLTLWGGRDHMVPMQSVPITTMLWIRISIKTRCTTLCDKVCQRLVTSQWFSPGPPVSSANKTDLHDIAEILLKVVLNTIKLKFAFTFYRQS